jgi:hypothetical protein
VHSIFDNLRVRITAIAVVQRSHAPVCCVRKKNFRDTQQGTIKELHVRTSGVFPRSETNATTIRSVITDIVTGKVSNIHPAQSDQHTNSVALLVDEGVATSKGMGFAIPTMIIWQEAD